MQGRVQFPLAIRVLQVGGGQEADEGVGIGEGAADPPDTPAGPRGAGGETASGRGGRIRRDDGRDLIAAHRKFVYIRAPEKTPNHQRSV